MAAFEEARLALRLLGGFTVAVDGHEVPDGAWRLRRAKGLVKLLALMPERRLHREQVVEALWPEGDAAARGLHQVLYTARRALAAGDNNAGVSLSLRDDVVALSGDGVWVDVEEFERAAAAARTEPSLDTYRAALDLYGGELLPEDRYEDWTSARRESLRETRLRLLVELGELQAASGDTAAAVETLQRAVVEDPLHEGAHRALMHVFADAGRRQQALAQYQQLRQVLRRELAADPDPVTSQLYREILAAQHEEAPAPAPVPVSEPAAESPPVGGLPHQLTSFIGRERELSELERALGRTRLLTLTGPGGCGKTRLALELAARGGRGFDDGTYLVELAPVGDPALVAQEAATALGVQLRSERDPIEVLAEQVGDRRLLLVLDNCEHLIDAAALLADRLLRVCPNLTIVATSRERLRIQGEVAWRVPPLSLPERAPQPDPAELERSEAIRLFCLRAGDATPGFGLNAGNAAAVAEICCVLDGMPLALELAAARTAALSPEQIAERLGDALALLRGGNRTGLTRQQTLRATLNWSHDLLTEPERALYRRLGVFAGSFDIDAVEGICSDDLVHAEDALDLLARLVDKSLVQVETAPGGHRYRVLETVRQDGLERLAQAGECERLEAAHRAWYLRLAEAADSDVDPDELATWPAVRLEPEHDNMRAALASAIRNDGQAAVRLASALWWFWMARGYFAEGMRWLSEALAAAPHPTPERARAVLASAAINVRRRYPLRTVPLAKEALEIARQGGDRHAEARALERLGVMAMGGFEWAEADRAFAEGLALAEKLGDEIVGVAIRHAQGVLAGCRAENAQARELLEGCLPVLAEIPDEQGPVFWAMHISPVILPAGPHGEMRSFFEDTFCLFRSVRSRAATGYALVNIGEAWRADGEYGAARESMEEALARFRQLDDAPGIGVALNALGNLARSAAEPELGRERFEEALALRRAAGDRREIATTLMGIGLLALYAGDATESNRLTDEAFAIYERTEDGPGLQGIPLNLAGYELDHGDPQRARVLLEQCIEICREQDFDRNRGWAAAELAEAALAIGDPELARASLDEALDVFERAGLRIRTDYARGLERRLNELAIK